MENLSCPTLENGFPRLPMPFNIDHLRFTIHHRRIGTVTRPLIIINNAAAKARRAWLTVRKQIEAGDIEFDAYETTRPGDATARTREALQAGVTTVAVVGGDGTLSEAAQGFFEFSERVTNLPSPINTRARLAILPAGTGDDFARGLVGQ